MNRKDNYFLFNGLIFFFKNYYLNSFFLYFDNINIISDTLGRISCFELGLFSGVNSLYIKKNKIIDSFIFLIGIENLNFDFFNSYLFFKVLLIFFILIVFF